MLHRNAALATAVLALIANVAVAQQPPQQPESGPKVGDIAPDFSLSASTRAGALPQPVTLAGFRGQTVVVAFFPRARTSGCTAQMTTYRDQWAELFKGGSGVQVIAISTDADTTQANWAREAKLPMIFGSDASGAVGAKYGAYLPDRKMDNRLLFVVAPDGRISYTAKPFKAMVADAYSELGEAVRNTAGAR